MVHWTNIFKMLYLKKQMQFVFLKCFIFKWLNERSTDQGYLNDHRKKLDYIECIVHGSKMWFILYQINLPWRIWFEMCDVFYPASMYFGHALVSFDITWHQCMPKLHGQYHTFQMICFKVSEFLTIQVKMMFSLCNRHNVIYKWRINIRMCYVFRILTVITGYRSRTLRKQYRRNHCFLKHLANVCQNNTYVLLITAFTWFWWHGYLCIHLCNTCTF